MKKNLLALFSVITLSASAQDYIPFLNNTSWCETTASWGGSNDTWIMPAGNETINGYDYVKYSSVPFMAYDVYLRENVSERKVYRLYNGTEVLLFDFTLQVNDQITLEDGTSLTVSSRDSVPAMTGRKRLRINLHGQLPGGWQVSESWTEGTGSWSHPFKRNYEMPSDPAGYITCNYNGTVAGFNRGILYGGNPITCELPAAGTATVFKPEITLYPNPLTDKLSISTTGYFNNAAVVVVNSLGQTVRSIKGITGYEIILQRDNLPSGLYMVNLIQEGKVIHSGKIIVTD